MPSASKKSVKKQLKKQPIKRTPKKIAPQPSNRPVDKLVAVYTMIRQRIRSLQLRRPHRSFRQTSRRDYVRSLTLPSYWAFTMQVRKVLWQHKTLFFFVIALYAILSGVLVGLASQSTYTELASLLKDSSGQLLQGNWGEIGKATILLGTGILGGINQTPTDAQKIFAPLIALLVWLTTIWLLRAIMAGHKPKLRDGLYNSASPIVSTFLVSLMFLVQLLPAALAALGIGAAAQSGFIASGVESMLFWVFVSLLTVLSLYWGTSTFIAMVVVTLPGMYPMQALRTAGDMVIGRRLRILLRLLWMATGIAVVWALIMIPVILIDAAIKNVWTNIAGAPIVPVALLIMSAFTIVWSSAYIYLLYRKIVDDDATPA